MSAERPTGVKSVRKAKSGVGGSWLRRWNWYILLGSNLVHFYFYVISAATCEIYYCLSVKFLKIILFLFLLFSNLCVVFVKGKCFFTFNFLVFSIIFDSIETFNFLISSRLVYVKVV